MGQLASMGPQTKRLRNSLLRCLLKLLDICFNGAANKTLAESHVTFEQYVSVCKASMGPQTKRLRNPNFAPLILVHAASFNGAANKTLAESEFCAANPGSCCKLQWGRKQNACGILKCIGKISNPTQELQWGRKQNACGIWPPVVASCMRLLCFNGAANKTLAEYVSVPDYFRTLQRLQWGRKQNACGIWSAMSCAVML